MERLVSSASSPILLRPYMAGDEAGILALYREVFDLEMPLPLWRWYYSEMPHGPAVVAVAEQEGRIVGHYAVQPRPFSLGAVPCLAGLAIGTMIHPAARDVTTLVELAQLAYDMCRERGILILYAFPNDQAWRVRKALLGWQELPQVVEWEGSSSALTDVFGEQHGLPDDLGKVASALQYPQFRFGTDNASTNIHTISGLRTWDWIGWRFFGKPDAEYVVPTVGASGGEPGVVEAYAAAKRYVRDGVPYGHILDWQTAHGMQGDKEAAGKLLFMLQRQFTQWNVERVSCWACPASSLRPYLRQAGFTPTGRQTNFGYLSLMPQADDLLKDGDAWDVQMADSDVY